MSPWARLLDGARKGLGVVDAATKVTAGDIRHVQTSIGVVHAEVHERDPHPLQDEER